MTNNNREIYEELSKYANPKWPPIIDSLVVVKTDNTQYFVGKVKANIWNNTASVLNLINNQEYIEPALINEPDFSGLKGHYLLLPLYKWRYIPTKVELDTSPESTLLLKLKNEKEPKPKDKIILSKADEIIKWIETNMIEKKVNNIFIFRDLQMKTNKKYVYITRKNIPTTDVITEVLLPRLKYLVWQYNLGIDYDTLLSIQTPKMQDEIKQVLTQEIYICLNPKPINQIWIMKLILICWYADEELKNHIRYIKVLIDKNTNKHLPSIIVVPKYGYHNSKLVYNKLTKYLNLPKDSFKICYKLDMLKKE